MKRGQRAREDGVGKRDHSSSACARANTDVRKIGLASPNGRNGSRLRKTMRKPQLWLAIHEAGHAVPVSR